MAAYVTYTYYTGTFLGTAIASTAFDALALRASAQVDMLTYARAAAIVTAGTETDTIDSIKMATCAVAEALQKQDAAGGQDNITAESVGSYSVSYGSQSSNAMSNDQKSTQAAKLYLWSTGLMYKGLTSEDEY